jgi:hypothetical protein
MASASGRGEVPERSIGAVLKHARITQPHHRHAQDRWDWPIVEAIGHTVDHTTGLARTTGVGRAITTYDVPIEGREEWDAAAARRLA